MLGTLRRQDRVHQTSPATRSSAPPSATAGTGGGADERLGRPAGPGDGSVRPGLQPVPLNARPRRITISGFVEHLERPSADPRRSRPDRHWHRAQTGSPQPLPCDPAGRAERVGRTHPDPLSAGCAARRHRSGGAGRGRGGGHHPIGGRRERHRPAARCTYERHVVDDAGSTVGRRSTRPPPRRW